MFILGMINQDFDLLSDSHFHILEMKKKNIDVSQTIKNWHDKSGKYLIDVGIDENHLNERLNYSKENSYILHTVGIHPNYAVGDTALRMKKIEDQLDNPKIVAIGETGLDYYREHTKKEIQKEFFIQHIELAIKCGKPIIIHNRDSSDDLLNILKQYKGKLSGIIHCFSSTIEFMDEFLKLGFYISFAGNITYKNNSNLLECINNIPLNKLLIETDSPYLSPQPLRGKLNTQCNIVHTYNFIAQSIGISIDTLKSQLDINIREVFKIKEST
ncbi:MAG: TatD family hydrolase [Spirochaetaceae bacterium]